MRESKSKVTVLEKSVHFDALGNRGRQIGTISSYFVS